MIMTDLLSKAVEFVVGIVSENEEVKKFPRDFVAASMQWIRSWFLTDDPVTEKVLTSDKPEAAKKAVAEAKVEDLLQNPTFKKELEALLLQYEAQRAILKNVVSQSNIEVAGYVHIGDTGGVSGEKHAKKNVVEGSTIKSGGKFRLGDDTHSDKQ
jgi:hypothetical protein